MNDIANELKLNEILGEKSKIFLLLCFSYLDQKLSTKNLIDWIDTTDILNILGLEVIENNLIEDALEYYETFDFINNDNENIQYLNRLITEEQKINPQLNQIICSHPVVSNINKYKEVEYKIKYISKCILLLFRFVEVPAQNVFFSVWGLN